MRFGLEGGESTIAALDAMINRAHDTDDMSSLRFAFTGAEKCPERIFL